MAETRMRTAVHSVWMRSLEIVSWEHRYMRCSSRVWLHLITFLHKSLVNTGKDILLNTDIFKYWLSTVLATCLCLFKLKQLQLQSIRWIFFLKNMDSKSSLKPLKICIVRLIKLFNDSVCYVCNNLENIVMHLQQLYIKLGEKKKGTTSVQNWQVLWDGFKKRIKHYFILYMHYTCKFVLYASCILLYKCIIQSRRIHVLTLSNS